MRIDQDLKTCIEKIEKLFFYDTLTLLDCVLEDDPIDPVYSANMVCERLERSLLFQKLYYKNALLDLSELLLANGYSEKDIALLKLKQSEEKSRNVL